MPARRPPGELTLRLPLVVVGRPHHRHALELIASRPLDYALWQAGFRPDDEAELVLVHRPGALASRP